VASSRNLALIATRTRSLRRRRRLTLRLAAIDRVLRIGSDERVAISTTRAWLRIGKRALGLVDGWCRGLFWSLMSDLDLFLGVVEGGL